MDIFFFACSSENDSKPGSAIIICLALVKVISVPMSFIVPTMIVGHSAELDLLFSNGCSNAPGINSYSFVASPAFPWSFKQPPGSELNVYGQVSGNNFIQSIEEQGVLAVPQPIAILMSNFENSLTASIPSGFPLLPKVLC